MEETLNEDEKRALRGSKFAPLPAPPSSRPQPRSAHPCGPMTTNKAAALSKFLERKLRQPGGIDSIDPQLLEVAVKNAKETVTASCGGVSTSRRTIRHVVSFDNNSEESEERRENSEEIRLKKKEKKRKKKDKRVRKKKKVPKMAQIPKCQKTVKMKKSKS